MFLLSAFLLSPILFSISPTQAEALVVVNQATISRQDLDQEMALLDAELQYRNHTLSKHQMAKLSSQLLENLIERELLYQRAQQRKIEIRDRWVDRAIADLKAELKSNTGFKAYLDKAHLDEVQLRTRIQKGLIVRRLLRRDVIRQIKVSEAEMQAFYRKHPEFFQRHEQIRVRQIMIAVNPPGDVSKRGDALLRMQAIQKQILDGGNFAALAIQFSEDKSSINGGDLGYLQRDQMIANFAEIAFSLSPGEVSEIIETHQGYHLIQLVDRIPFSQMAYRNARTKIERTLRRDKEESAADAYLSRLKRQASIKRLAR